jgi:hypothetical protein
VGGTGPTAGRDDPEASAVATHPDRRVTRTLWLTLVVATLLIASRAVLADIVEARHIEPGTMSSTIGSGVSIPGSDAVQVDGPTMTSDTITGGIGADGTRPIRATVPVSASFITTVPSTRPLRSPTPATLATVPTWSSFGSLVSMRPVASLFGAPTNLAVASASARDQAQMSASARAAYTPPAWIETFPIATARPSLVPVLTPTPGWTPPVVATFTGTLPSIRPVPVRSPTPLPSSDDGPRRDSWTIQQSDQDSVLVGNVRTNDPAFCGLGNTSSIEVMSATGGIWVDTFGDVRVDARYAGAQQLTYRLVCQWSDPATGTWAAYASTSARAEVIITPR